MELIKKLQTQEKFRKQSRRDSLARETYIKEISTCKTVSFSSKKRRMTLDHKRLTNGGGIYLNLYNRSVYSAFPKRELSHKEASKWRNFG